jgi:hypothetical protein
MVTAMLGETIKPISDMEAKVIVYDYTFTQWLSSGSHSVWLQSPSSAPWPANTHLLYKSPVFSFAKQ